MKKTRTRLMITKTLYWAIVRSLIFGGLILAPVLWLNIVCAVICASNALYALITARKGFSRETIKPKEPELG